MPQKIDEEFWKVRRCLRAPIPEIYFAAHLLDRAVSAHLAGNAAEAEDLIRCADTAEIRNWTESLWGSQRDNPDQPKYKRFRAIQNAPAHLPQGERLEKRMPGKRERSEIIERYGRHCVFCGIPLIGEGVRKRMNELYPEAAYWEHSNARQHSALQCMWLQFDHLLPHSRGGDNDVSNVVVTCAPCNYGRGDHTIEELGLLDPRLTPHYQTSWDGLERLLNQD
jgi:hypothetical protein|tara:strand:+ start:4317 stop:4985 length:669 start_codon:yes stop_codon:yes gene_type:complete